MLQLIYAQMVSNPGHSAQSNSRAKSGYTRQTNHYSNNTHSETTLYLVPMYLTIYGTEHSSYHNLPGSRRPDFYTVQRRKRNLQSSRTAANRLHSDAL